MPMSPELRDEHVHVVGAVPLRASARHPRHPTRRGRWRPRCDRGSRCARPSAAPRRPRPGSSSCPRPARCAPMRLRKARQIGDLGLTRRVVDHGRALGQDGRHQHVLGRADARELEQDAGAPRALRHDPRCSRARTRTWPRVVRARSGACRSGGDRSRPHRASATRARPYRASNGPSTTIDARMRSTSS